MNITEREYFKRALTQSKALRDLPDDLSDLLFRESELISLNQGQTLLRPDIIESSCFLVVDGSLRLLSKDSLFDELFTVGQATSGDILGFIDILRQASCEAAIARRPSTLFSFPSAVILDLLLNNSVFHESVSRSSSPCELAFLLEKHISTSPSPPSSPKNWILEQIAHNDNSTITSPKKLLSSNITGWSQYVASSLTPETAAKIESQSKLPIRYVDWYEYIPANNVNKTAESPKIDIPSSNSKSISATPWSHKESFDLSSLGIKESSTESDFRTFKIIRGNGLVNSNLALMRMVARAYQTPCPVDVIENIFESVVKRSSSIPIHAIGQIIESMGLQTQIGTVNFENLHRLEFPVIVQQDKQFKLLVDVRKERLLIADPESGWNEISFEDANSIWEGQFSVVLIKRLSDTPRKTFGWSWFTPVLKKFKWPLVQVLFASLFIQLFQLANPLLLQQIIDKVINQSNLSALQVLGGALVAAALFQGILTSVRTWLLIDTTDRMDLVLGTQVIDKLLRLPLRFFEKRPVGELSQRLGELSNLRSFLTGTAITSLLDILFAIIYIFIMFMYSPLLSVVALCTVPLYILLIIFVAPLYRSLIRKQAQFAAKTQSHLIETLSGVQTVKAQHFELNSRWRWQERYASQIAEGFKSVVLGSAAGEVGSFLNQLSSLLIIWVGVYLVVEGKLSLGQLIAFRIIAGYVTGPILRLSSLWQGFQQVGISMERLADIVDQIPETDPTDSNQIALPPVKGDIKFQNLKFRFGSSGPYQIDGLSLEIKQGSFVGIVGQSGSGKSTLMKLLPRLYEPESGRIMIDGFDISKVSLNSVRQQIGIVPQECLLFEGTIRENISMNDPEADMDSVLKAAKAAAAHDFIMDLPEGYKTHLGERGAGLSGGQKQRIAIARTILQNPNLLVMDEATSALDYDTESTVCDNLQKILKGKTVFFITHRLSTVKNSDLIVVMNAGKIDEVGNHKELMAAGGRYSRLYSLQDND